ncbi:MAG: S8 family serine peptidase [Bacteroidota bacterium]
MKKLLILIPILTCQLLYSQKLAPQTYWFYLKDKPQGSYSTSNPADYLSQRSIDRRAWQGLPVDQRDLPVWSAYLDSLRSKGIVIRSVSRWLNGVAVVLPAPLTPEEVSTYSFISALPWEPDPYDLYYPPKPSGERFSSTLPAREPDYGMSAAQVKQIALERLHEAGYTGSGVWISVMDAGFDRADILPAFDSLFATDRILKTRDFVNPGGGVYGYHYHGMSVLSIIGGYIPGELCGTAPDASFILCRTEDGDSELKIEESNWIAAAEWADSLGADVLNTSLGYSVFDDPEMNYSYSDLDGHSTLISQAASLLAGRGMVLSVSAGNEGAKEWYYISAPADAENVLTVGAVDSLGVIAAFSSRGPTWDHRIKPDVCAMGYQTAIQSTDSTVRRGNGTSYSSPVMAGAMACLWQVFPEMPAEDLIRLVISYADRSADPDITYGFGIPDLSRPLTVSVPVVTAGNSLFFYPNPCRYSFTYVLPGGEEQEDDLLSLTDLQGRIVMETRATAGTPVSLPENLAPGLYLLGIHNGNGSHYGRIIVER